jgi:hypothetical protein
MEPVLQPALASTISEITPLSFAFMSVQLLILLLDCLILTETTLLIPVFLSAQLAILPKHKIVGYVFFIVKLQLGAIQLLVSV